MTRSDDALALVAASAGGVALGMSARDYSHERPRLALLTSLPLLLANSSPSMRPKKRGAGADRAALHHRDARHSRAASLKDHTLLLMAHARAQPPRCGRAELGYGEGGAWCCSPIHAQMGKQTKCPATGSARRPLRRHGLLGHWG